MADVNILSYNPNPSLGLGGNADIPVSHDPNLLNVVNDTAKNIMFLDADRNAKIFQQKIKDRDDLLKMIDDGQVQSGDILPQFRKDFDAAQKDAEDAHNNIKGINDMKGREEYKKNVAHLKDVATWAQHKTLMAQGELKEAAADTLPSRQAARKKNLEQNLKAGFWDEYTPYQQTLSGDLPGLMDYAKKDALVPNSGIATPTPTQNINITTQKTTAGKPTVTTQKQIVRPVKGSVSGGNIPRGTSVIGAQQGTNGALSPMQTVSGKYYDYDKILNNVQKGYLSTDETQRYNMDWFRQQIENGDPKSAMNMIDYANKRIAQYNQERGVTDPNAKGFVKTIQPGQDVIVTPDGKVHLNLSTPEFTAKMALAGIDGNYVEKDQSVFNKDIDKSNLDWARLKAQKGALKALEAQRYAKSNLDYKKAKAIDNQFNPQQAFDELFKGKMATQETENGNIVTRVNLRDISKELQDVLGIAPINQQGDYNLIPANITQNGKQVSEDLIYKGYTNWLNSPQAQKIQEAKGGEKPNVFEFIYSQPNSKFEVEVQGKTKPVNKASKYGNVVVDEGGKLIRSNRLQALLNQMNQGGVKGKELIKLLSEGSDNNEGETGEELNITKESGTIAPETPQSK